MDWLQTQAELSRRARDILRAVTQTRPLLPQVKAELARYGMTIKVLRKPYNQADMARALRDALAA